MSFSTGMTGLARGRRPATFLAIAIALGLGLGWASWAGCQDEPGAGVDMCEGWPGLQQGAAWPMLGGCPDHRGRSPVIGTDVLEVKWAFATAGVVWSAPAIDAEGTVYFGSTDSRLYAISAEGELLWSFDAGGAVVSTPAIGPGPVLYFGTLEGMIYAIDGGGGVEWSFDAGTGIAASPALGRDRTIYIANSAFAPDGTPKWPQEGWSSATPAAIGPDGTIYVGTASGSINAPDHLYALDSQGSQKWFFSTESWIWPSPVVGADGTVYFASSKRVGFERVDILYAVNSDGVLQWEFELPEDGPNSVVRAAPVIGRDGTIYLSSPDGNLFAVSPDGTLKWEYHHATSPSISPTIGGDGTIYLPAAHNLLALDPDGNLLWELELEYRISTAVAIGPDGVLHFGTRDGKLLAIGPGGPGDLSHPPLAGQCGLAGQWVWCNTDEDCLTYIGGANTCDTLGYCYHTMPDADDCIYAVGNPCYAPDRYCNWFYKCTTRCETHDDCFGGACWCGDGSSLCVYHVCEDDTCPAHTVPLDGTLVCQPEPGYLEGECHGVGGVCDAGYTPVGERGCVATP